MKHEGEVDGFEEPTFAVVQCARAGYDSSTVEGVFSRDEDAACLVDDLKSSKYIWTVPAVQRLPMKTVIEILLSDRLQALAEPLKIIAAAMQKDDVESEPTWPEDIEDPDRPGILPTGDLDRECCSDDQCEHKEAGGCGKGCQPGGTGGVD